MVSSMGMLTMPQFVISAAIGGGESAVLKPSSTTAAGNLVVSPEECERAAEELLGEKPPRTAELPAELGAPRGVVAAAALIRGHPTNDWLVRGGSGELLLAYDQ